MIDLDTAQKFNAVAFIQRNNIVNENGYPIEFKAHRFLLQPYMDNSKQQVVMKAAQVGWSTLAIIRAFHLAKFAQANIIYTLPSRNAVKDFVRPKVDPLIENNPVLQAMIGDTDSVQLKKVGDRFVYFRGSYEESSAISISAHILIADEFDRSNQKVLRTYKSRLDASQLERPELGWYWIFSNPYVPSSGVHAIWENSDQKHWFVKCKEPKCRYEWFLSFPESIDFDKECYICQKCHHPLSKEDIISGRWVKKRESEISGYWINQMMVPWIPASKIIEESKGDQQVFYNFTLGLPYQSADESVTREAIVKCIVPSDNPRTSVAMGVDNGIEKHYVIGNQYGIFKIGRTESWEEIEDLRNRYGAVMVVDAMPYPAMPKRLVEKYPGKVFMHYYSQDKKQIGIVRWGEGDNKGVVNSDRTKIIDSVVADINAADFTYNLTVNDLEIYIAHWEKMYRQIVEASSGIKKPVWKTAGQDYGVKKPDHYVHATIYWRIAMEKASMTGSGIIRTQSPHSEGKNPTIGPDETVPGLDLKELIKKSNRPERDWRRI